MATIWILIEEAETGSFADMSTYCLVSAHRSEGGADDARDAWRKSHGEPAHAFDDGGNEDEDFCQTCQTGVAVAQVDLAD